MLRGSHCTMPLYWHISGNLVLTHVRLANNRNRRAIGTKVPMGSVTKNTGRWVSSCVNLNVYTQQPLTLNSPLHSTHTHTHIQQQMISERTQLKNAVQKEEEGRQNAFCKVKMHFCYESDCVQTISQNSTFEFSQREYVNRILNTLNNMHAYNMRDSNKHVFTHHKSKHSHLKNNVLFWLSIVRVRTCMYNVSWMLCAYGGRWKLRIHGRWKLRMLMPWRLPQPYRPQEHVRREGGRVQEGLRDQSLHQTEWVVSVWFFHVHT